MILKSKIAAAVAAVAIAASLTVPSGEAEARRWGYGLLGGLIVGAAIANSGPVHGFSRCKWVHDYVDGVYVGKVKVCKVY
jgi:hypothetical protein